MPACPRPAKPPGEKSPSNAIPARAFVIRYPNGDFEYDFTRKPVPLVGDTPFRKQHLWRVSEITRDEVATVRVEAVPTFEQATSA